jgi:hypothetical protein
LLLIISRIPLEAFDHQFYDTLYALLGGVFSVGRRTSNHQLQGPRQLRHRDGTHPKRHRCRARLAGPCSNALDLGAMLRLEIFKCLLRRLHRLGP